VSSDEKLVVLLLLLSIPEKSCTYYAINTASCNEAKTSPGAVADGYAWLHVTKTTEVVSLPQATSLTVLFFRSYGV
jgi:hypothetical protein